MDHIPCVVALFSVLTRIQNLGEIVLELGVFLFWHANKIYACDRALGPEYCVS